MTRRQLEAQKAGILARTKALRDAGVPFDDYRVMQVLDAAFLLKREGVTDWETLYSEIHRLYGEHCCGVA